MATENITLDGVTGFNAFGTSYTWSAASITRVSVGIDPGVDPNEENTLNFSLAGAAWRIRQLNFYNDIAFDFNVTLTDANDGVFRRIDGLQVSGSGDTNITLFNTRVRFLEVFDDRTLTLTLGTERLNYMQSDGGGNTIALGSGTVTSMRLGGSERTSVNTVTGGTGFIGQLEFGEGSTNTVNIGAYFGSIRTFGVSNTFTFTDGGESLVLVSGVSTVNLNNGFYASVTAFEGTNTINVAADADVRSIGINGGVDNVTVSGFVEQITLGSDNDTLTINADGGVNIANLGNGNNTIVVGSNASLDGLSTYDGLDRLTVNGGFVGVASLGGGRNVVIMTDGRISYYEGYDGDDAVTITGGEINVIRAGGGLNIIRTADQFVSLIEVNGGNDRVTIGGGGAGTLKLGGGANSLTTGAGFVEFVQSFEGDDRITIGSGKAGTIDTGEGNDILNLTDGRADLIDTGTGNDTVTLGEQSSRFVVLGEGDDTISLSRGNPNFGVEIQGDAGIDTANFARFAAAITVTLDDSSWQNPGGILNLGYVAMIGIENLIGTEFRDRLTGSEAANVINGGKGRDVISGLGGDDRLIAGLGNDLIRGGAGADTFVMNSEGIDQIADFVVGEDKIELLAANDLADLTFTTTALGVQVTFGAVVINVDAVTLLDMQNADNFIF